MIQKMENYLMSNHLNKMKNIKIKINLLLLLSLLISTATNGQNQLPKDSFVVVKSYKPVIAASEKINLSPIINDTQKVVQSLKYNFMSKQVPVNFSVEPIAAAKIKGEPLVKLYNGYARLGVGNNTFPLAEVYYHNTRSKKYSLGTHLKYQLNDNINKYKKSGFNAAKIEVFGQKYWRSNTLDGNISYDREKLHYYGYERNDASEAIADTMDTKQIYNLFSVNVGLKTTKQDSFNLRHDVDLNFYRIADRGGDATENNIVANAKLSQFHGNELYFIDATLDYNSSKNPLKDKNSTIFSLRPQISSIGKQLKVNVGIGIYMDAVNTASFHFYPIVDVSYNAFDDVFVPYAGLRGRIQRNNYRSITRVNEFVNNNLDLINTNVKYELFGGIRGSISSKLSFNAAIEKSKYANYALFVKDTALTLQNEFTVIYDDIEQLKLTGELMYQQSEKLKVYLRGDYFGYNPGNELEVWHKPEYKISLMGVYDLNDKILVRVSLNNYGKQYAKIYRAETTGSTTTLVADKEKLKGVFDANLGVEYRYTKRLSAFVNFNNIGSVNYQRWQDYPTQRFNILGGLTYSF